MASRLAALSASCASIVTLTSGIKLKCVTLNISIACFSLYVHDFMYMNMYNEKKCLIFTNKIYSYVLNGNACLLHLTNSNFALIGYIGHG